MQLVLGGVVFYNDNAFGITLLKLTACSSCYSLRWTVDEMIEVCNLSTKAQTGMSPKNYLLASKIKYTTNLLSFDGVNVKKAAEMAGFMDTFHFSRVFKKIMGISPRKYTYNLKRKPYSDEQ
jgi:AraC-like DNA-binding protein